MNDDTLLQEIKIKYCFSSNKLVESGFLPSHTWNYPYKQEGNVSDIFPYLLTDAVLSRNTPDCLYL